MRRAEDRRPRDPFVPAIGLFSGRPASPRLNPDERVLLTFAVGLIVVVATGTLAFVARGLRIVPVLSLSLLAALGLGVLAWWRSRNLAWLRYPGSALLLVSCAVFVVVTRGHAFGATCMLFVLPCAITLLAGAWAGGAALAVSMTALALVGAPALDRFLPSPEHLDPSLPHVVPTAAFFSTVLFAVSLYGDRVRRRVVARGQRHRRMLATSELRYRAFAENAQDLVSELDASGRVLYASPSHRETLGVAPSSLIGRRIRDIVYAEDREAAQRFVEEVASGTATEPRLFRVAHTSGALRWVRVSARAYRHGDQARIVAHGRDETRLRAVEEERLRLIVGLQQALEAVQTLRGIIPICAECRRVRTESGAWQQVEEYVSAHSLADFSHGICEQCLGARMQRTGSTRRANGPER